MKKKPLPDLTPRDVRMLKLASEGLDSRGIAEAMGLEFGTMRVYLHYLYKRLGVTNRAAAVAWWLKHSGVAERAARAPTTKKARTVEVPVKAPRWIGKGNVAGAYDPELSAACRRDDYRALYERLVLLALNPPKP